MSIETEISSLTTAIRNLTDVLLATVAKSLPTPTATEFPSSMSEFANTLAPTMTENITPAPEPKKTVKKDVVEKAIENIQALTAPTVTPEPHPGMHRAAAPAPAPAPVPTVSEDDLRVQIVELARPNMADAAFKAFLGGKLSELQGAPCSISGTGKLPKIDAAHLPTLLAAINKQLGK